MTSLRLGPSILRNALWLLVASMPTTSLLAQQGAVEDWANPFYPGYWVQRPAGSDFVQLAVARDSSVGLRADGSIVTWGTDYYGQISNSPTGTGYTQVSAGYYLLMALSSDGSIVQWPEPYPNLPSGPGFTRISAGYLHYLALRSDGTIEAWGNETHGEILDTPSGNGFVDVLAGSSFSAALRTDGSIVAWGTDLSGLVSNVPSGTGFTQLAGGHGYVFALQSDGTIVGWGSNSFGLQSDIPSGPGFLQVTAGGSRGHAIDANGRIVSWGDDGNSGLVSRTPEGTGFVQVSAGSRHSAALRTRNSGSPYCFGDATGHFCPCDQYGIPGEGCGNSDTTNGGAQLIGFGEPSLSADTFGFYVENAKYNQSGILLSGTQQLGAGLGVIAGDGLLCLSGQTQRSHIQAMSSYGSTTFTDFMGQPFGTMSSGVGVPTTYQFWYRDPQQSCTGAKFNFSNAWTVNWSL